MTAIEGFAPAKINLTLHVTGQREDGYHLLDSLVMFADVGDRLVVQIADAMSLEVTGPFAAGVPTDAANLCWRAAEMFGETVAIKLEKYLPHPAGIGGGSSDAAAVLRAMEKLFHRPFEGDALKLGADVPVCLMASAARMQGVGEILTPLNLNPIEAVIVNPRVVSPTPQVFRRLAHKVNSPMTDMPSPAFPAKFWSWLEAQRNDLEHPAQSIASEISEALHALSGRGARVVRMSGSGATCFALFDTRGLAALEAKEIAREYPDWWVQDVRLS